MSFVADFIGGAVEAVGNVVDSVASAVGNVVDSIGSNPLAAIAAAALAIATSGASLAADGVVAAADAAAYITASETAGAFALDAYTAVEASAVVSPSTWAAFGSTASTADLYTAATASAVNTSVADYAAAAVAGEATGAATAFTYLPVSSLGPAVSAGFLETALEVAKGVKKAVDTVRIVNTATRQQSIVPRNAPLPVGWAQDAGWSPSLGDTGAKYSYDPATGALMLQSSTTPDAAAVVPAAGTVSPVLVLAALAGAVFFLVK